MSTALLWYRRDLRLHDHPALHAALAAHDRVVPVFVLDPVLLNGRFSSAARGQFMLGCVDALDDELRARGTRLVLRSGTPERELTKLAADSGAQAVYWTSDVGPYARARDRRVTEALREAGVQAVPTGGNYVIDVSEIATQQGRPYSVFSPFFRHWERLARRPLHRAPESMPALAPGLDPGEVPETILALRDMAGPAAAAPLVRAGEPAAREAAARWLADPITRYADRHDDLSGHTAQLSPYLRWGCLSASELEARARGKGGEGAGAWVRQLCWRDFYAHVLLRWPENLRHEFQPRFRQLEWEDSPEHLAAWQRGETGYPVVDAAMRQLAHTGWMHNRARLIVGSFLTKDLHLDWRHGEAWFERLLLDGEPPQNNGNWQWVASVGTDPAPPARRMYNPTRQAQRFDPGGAYVRRWVPELRDVPDDVVHEPWTMSESRQRESGCRIGRDYPAPIVDHHHERRRALERYGAARASTG